MHSSSVTEFSPEQSRSQLRADAPYDRGGSELLRLFFSENTNLAKCERNHEGSIR